MTVDRSLSKIPPPQEKQLQMFLEMGMLDMFRLALDREEQVWGYGPALLCILLHYTSFLISLLPSLSFFPYSNLFFFIILWIYGSLLFQILFYSSSLFIILPLPNSLLLSGLPHSPLFSFSSSFFFLVIPCFPLFFFHLFYFFHGPFCQVQPKTTKGWVTWESGENWDVLRVLLIISVCG